MIAAEGMFSLMIAKHNLPFSVADHFSELVKNMFPDSEIAKKYGAARTKATCMIRGNILQP